MSDPLRDAALDYHRRPTPGKLALVATKPLANQRDLALAYSPGVAAATSSPASGSDLASFFAIDSGWPTLQLSR